MGTNTGKGFGFNLGGGGGGTNTNVANSDLTLDDNYTTDLDDKILTFDSSDVEIIKLNGVTDKLVIGAASDDYSMPSDRPTIDQVLKATDGSGTLAWSSDTDTNTNIAKDDLLLDGNHTTDTAGHTLTFDNGTTEMLKLDGGRGEVKIGGSGDDYTMPTTRPAINKTLNSIDAAGTLGFQSLTSVLEKPSQTPCGQGLFTGAFVRDEMYVPTPTNTLISVGRDNITTINTTALNFLANPFRNSGSTNPGIDTGTDKMIIKLRATKDGDYNINIIRVSLPTGTAVASAPIVVYNIGTINYFKMNNLWTCMEFELSGVLTSPCCQFYVAATPRVAGVGEDELQMIATYSNPREIINTWS